MESDDMVGATFSCPRCGRPLDNSSRGAADQQFQCPHCHQRFVFKRSQSDATEPPEIPRRRRRRLGAFVVPGSVAAGILLVAILFAWDRMAHRQEQADGSLPTAPSDPSADRAVGKEIAEHGISPVTARNQASDSSGRKDVRQPIRLLLVPDGARILVHLRPSDLWRPAGRGQELCRCLPTLADWTERQIIDWCLFPPKQIEEVLFAFVLSEPGEPPNVSATVWLTGAIKETDLFEKFGGKRRDKSKLPTSIKDDRALVVLNEKTFAVGPLSAADEMAEANDEPNPTDESIEELLKETDKGREITVLFRPDDLDRFRESLVPPRYAELARLVAQWLDPDATEGAVMSLRLANPFRIRLALRNRPLTSERRLQESLAKRVGQLPSEILGRVKQLNPQTVGQRKLIGRVPAMWKAVSLGVASTAQPRLVTFESVLPERAAPNLSLGTYLALQAQLAAPDVMDRSGVTARARPSDKPKSVAERLRQQVDVDFRRIPLSEAFASIGEDIGLTFEVDGGALKVAGYTKNMPQTFRLKSVPATEALQTILKPYPKMALVIDDTRQIVIVTTRDAAQTKGQKPLEFGK